MIIDLFGTQHNRYARRNAGNALKSELEAAGVTEQAKENSTPNLSALFSGPTVKRAVAKKDHADTDIGKPIIDLVPIRIISVTKCEGGTCTRTKVCK